MPQPFETLSCDQACGRIEAWIDGDLDQKTADKVRRHIEECPSCRNELELAEEVCAALRGLPSLETPARVLQAVQLATEERPVPSVWWTRPVAALTAIAAAVLFALVVTSERQKPLPRADTAEVERVTAETRVALAYLASATRRAEARLRTRVAEDRAVAATLNGVSSSLRWTRGVEQKPTTGIENEGSL